MAITFLKSFPLKEGGYTLTLYADSLTEDQEIQLLKYRRDKADLALVPSQLRIPSDKDALVEGAQGLATRLKDVLAEMRDTDHE